MKKILATAFYSLFLHFLFAQDNSDSAGNCPSKISLLTCTPGTELYSTFGHSALRVKDSTAGTDIIYNYGTFDFDDPSFYKKFVRGKLLYFVSEEPFADFFGQYQYEERGITEQILNLSCEEKQQLLSQLQENAKEENKYYKYDFVYDNCTTRLRDIVMSKNKGTALVRDIRDSKDITFRDLIHEYLDRSYQYWSKLGIDILLGSPLDKNLDNNEAMFLPDYLLKGFDSTSLNGKTLVAEKIEILHPAAATPEKPLVSPFTCFAGLLLLIAALSFIIRSKKFHLYFDFLLFFLTGALGLLLLFMWFGTDHQTCRHNFNLVWAFPPNIVISFFLLSKKRWPRRYFLFNVILLGILLVGWTWLPQEMNNALLPIVALLLLRSFMRYKRPGYGR